MYLRTIRSVLLLRAALKFWNDQLRSRCETKWELKAFAPREVRRMQAYPVISKAIGRYSCHGQTRNQCSLTWSRRMAEILLKNTRGETRRPFRGASFPSFPCSGLHFLYTWSLGCDNSVFMSSDCNDDPETPIFYPYSCSAITENRARGPGLNLMHCFSDHKLS